MSLKRNVRVWAERGLAVSGVTARAESRMRESLTILTFHRVLPDNIAATYPFPSLAVPLGLFRSMIESLALRYDLMTVREGLTRAADLGSSKAKPVVALSFDDGYSDNIRLAMPVLEQAGVKATFYVVAGLVGTDEEFWYDVAARRFLAIRSDELLTMVRPVVGESASQLDVSAGLQGWMQWLKSLDPLQREQVVAALPEPGRQESGRDLDRVMTADDLRGLVSAGHEVGSHTLTHPLLPQLDDRTLEKELVGSRRTLENWLQSPVTGFCYPNGDHDDRVVDAVRHAGYSHACTTKQGRNQRSADPYRLRRVDMHPGRLGGPSGEFELSSARATVSLVYRHG